ncbi:hypothetical protein [Halomarina litorea]|uniref:hypothetical protein n=1 Tax=Halomarina litorea TaxID=2961595 RepID=UPI0020C494DB|nr:hypothetical protein [Halomarina sp. BCD28]
MSTAQGERRDFLAFYRDYARTGIHAATTAALTAFGLLSTVHPGFIAVAIAAYVLPLVYFYLSDDGPSEAESDAGHEADGSTDTAPWSGSDRAGDTADDRGGHGDASGGTATGGDGDADADSDGDTDTDGDSDTDTDTDSDNASSGEWTPASVPSDATLHAVAEAADGPYAAGADGVVLARRGTDWEVVVESGPAAESKTLRGCAATDDDEAVWVAGDGGAVGRWGVEDGRMADHSAPDDETGTWTDVAVTGGAGSEHVYLVNGSGAVLRGRYVEREMTWDSPTKPGSGSSLSAVEFADEVGYACDTNATVFRTEDAGDSYDVLGVEDAGSGFSDVAASGETVVVTDDEGGVTRYDGSVWTPRPVADGPLTAVDLHGGRGLACGEDGALYELDGTDWGARSVFSDATLRDVLASGDLAVGDDGTVLHRD